MGEPARTSLVSEVPEETLSFWNGDHRMEGIFLAYGNNIRPGLSARSPCSRGFCSHSALCFRAPGGASNAGTRRCRKRSHLVLPPRSLTLLVSRPDAHAKDVRREERPVNILSPQEEEALAERLKGLGYLE